MLYALPPSPSGDESLYTVVRILLQGIHSAHQRPAQWSSQLSIEDPGGDNRSNGPHEVSFLCQGRMAPMHLRWFVWSKMPGEWYTVVSS